MPGWWLKPNRSAVATRRAAPSLTPSGENTELHDTAKASSSDPPHSSPLALFNLTPSSVANVAYGKTVCGVAILAASTPVVVTILNVEPGGCRPSRPIPATARIRPVEGCIATTPP